MMNRPYNYDREKIEHVSGIFNATTQLNQAMDSLDRLGMGNDVSLLMSEETRSYYGDTWQDEIRGTEGFEHTNKMPEGTATGGLAGGILGAIIGGLTLVGSIIIPGSGLLVAGPLVGAITGGAIGVATGGLLGALVGAGIPETEAKFYEESLKKQGNALLVAHVPKDMVNEVKEVFKRCGAESVKVV
ncbi:hypothetical protein [Vampirovibrio sp.]|uniref:hypothetical protein n=1 Tax=Vampirovibrio sp. TaxID=2717857 RepID=UPI0035934438